MLLILYTFILFIIILNLFLFFFYRQSSQQQTASLTKLIENSGITLEAVRQLKNDRQEISQLLTKQLTILEQQRQTVAAHQVQHIKVLHDSISQAMQDVRQQLSSSLQQHAELLNQQIANLTKETKMQLHAISGEVNKQLSSGFEKTTATFTDVIKRLAIIDQAQQKITELSTNVVGLQQILTDKRSRGAFGEVQLISLVKNMIPEKHYKLQYTLSNDKRADCILFLPEPTGNIVIDAKFPLETYRQLCECQTMSEQKQLSTQFKIDIRKHVNDIAEKYIIANETADGAMMFIPAEAIFAEIHAKYPDVIEYAHQRRVWLVSPTTMMAILTTARAVLKDAATRKQVHIIQEHLVALSKDFDRFQNRMHNLAKHIGQAQEDVEQVHKSSKKISNRFLKIEKVELDQTLT